MEQRNRWQNIWLIGLTVMTALFLVLLNVSRSNKGVLFHDALLKVQGVAENGAYFGKAHGEDVSIVVSRHSETEIGLEFYISNVVHENWLVEYPLTTVQTEHGPKPGLRISRDGEAVYEGACDPKDRSDVLGHIFYNEYGVWDPQVDLVLHTEYSDGGYWDYYETGISTVMDFAFGPPMVSRGDGVLFLYGLLMAVLAAVQVAFPNALFQWNHRWYVKDPEPTEFYFGMIRLSSGILTVIALVLYIMSIRTIP